MLNVYRASAGSGKTFKLTYEYIKMLLGRRKETDEGYQFYKNYNNKKEEYMENLFVTIRGEILSFFLQMQHMTFKDILDIILVSFVFYLAVKRIQNMISLSKKYLNLKVLIQIILIFIITNF